MKNTVKTLISFIAAVMMFAMVLPTFAAENTEDTPAVGAVGEGYVVIDCEGLTLGQGYYCEPMLLSYEQIVNIYNASHDDQVTVETLTAGHATLVMYELMGWEYHCTGNIPSGTIYISEIKDIDTGVIDIPEVITNNGSNISNDNNDGNDDEWLGEFDYSWMSGWMITVDNFMIDVGCAGWLLDGNHSSHPISDYDGTHIIRWQFSLDCYGADLGIDTGWGNEAFFPGADKGELTKLYAEIKDLTNWFAENPSARQAALDVLTHLDATQEEVDAAYQMLYNAYFLGVEPTPGIVDSFVVTDAQAALGETFPVTFSIEKYSNLCNLLYMNVEYDTDLLEFVSYEGGQLYQAVAPDNAYAENMPEEGIVECVVYSQDAETGEDIPIIIESDTASILTINFRIKDGAAAGTTTRIGLSIEGYDTVEGETIEHEVSPGTVNITAVELQPWQIALDTTLEYIFNTVAEPMVGSVGGEWSVLTLARGNYFDTLSNEYFDTYRQTVIDYITESGMQDHGGTILHARKSTDNSRVIISLASIGIDARDVGGYDLVTPLFDYEYTVWQGINGPVFALIALDTFAYDAPEGVRESYIENILNNQSPGGGWALGGVSADPDMTGMTIQALAPYCESNEAVRAAVDTALEVLSELQRDDGSYASWGVVTSESCAQVLTALTALGINPTADSRFIKNGNTVIDAILRFYVDGGGFRHILSGEINGMATDQATYALVAYSRFLNDQNRLYDMTDTMPEPPVYQTGDIDMNGSIEVSDALLLMRYAIGIYTLTDAQFALADINGDGYVNTIDAALLLREAAALN